MTILFTVEIDILLIQLQFARQFYRFDPRSMKLILRVPTHIYPETEWLLTKLKYLQFDL